MAATKPLLLHQFGRPQQRLPRALSRVKPDRAKDGVTAGAAGAAGAARRTGVVAMVAAAPVAKAAATAATSKDAATRVNRAGKRVKKVALRGAAANHATANGEATTAARVAQKVVVKAVVKAETARVAMVGRVHPLTPACPATDRPLTVATPVSAAIAAAATMAAVDRVLVSPPTTALRRHCWKTARSRCQPSTTLVRTFRTNPPPMRQIAKRAANLAHHVSAGVGVTGTAVIAASVRPETTLHPLQGLKGL